MTKLTQLTQLLWLVVRELLSVASASVGIWIIIPVRGVLKLINGRSLPDQTSIWLVAWPQQSTRPMPAELILDGKAERKQYQTKPNQYQHPTNPDSSTVKQNWLSWLGKMTNRKLNGWSSDGVAYHAFTRLVNLVNQYLCQLMVFQVPLKPLEYECLPGWTHTGKNGKNKWVKQY